MAVALVLIGLGLMIGRKKALSQIAGLIIMENGVYLAALVATLGLPVAVELGVFFDLLVGVLLLGVFAYRINQTFDTSTPTACGRCAVRGLGVEYFLRSSADHRRCCTAADGPTGVATPGPLVRARPGRRFDAPARGRLAAGRARVQRAARSRSTAGYTRTLCPPCWSAWSPLSAGAPRCTESATCGTT